VSDVARYEVARFCWATLSISAALDLEGLQSPNSGGKLSYALQ
jgi:hypothetical protein